MIKPEDLIATEYSLKTQFDACKVDCIRICRCNSSYAYKGEKWAVRLLGFCLNKNGMWDEEPSPSSRDKDFFDRCRFDSMQEALEAINLNEQKKTTL